MYCMDSLYNLWYWEIINVMAKIRKGMTPGGRFAKGNQLSKGPRDKPAPMKALKQLQQAIKNVEEDKGINLFEEFVRQALKEKTMFIALMKKVVPDLSQVTLGEDGQVSISFNIKDFRDQNTKATGELKIP